MSETRVETRNEAYSNAHTTLTNTTNRLSSFCLLTILLTYATSTISDA